MRKTYLLFASASVVLLSACGSQSKSAIDADLRKDLELASSDDGISLGNGAVTSGQQFVSSIERTSPPARKVAASARVKRNKPAPKAPPKVVPAEAPADITESEIQSVATAPIEVAPEAPVSPRPQPIAVSYPSGGSSVGSDGGSAAGAVLGTILGAVIRGGVVGDIDHCDERTGRRRGTVISVNNRMPFPTGRSGLGRVAIGRGRTGGDITSRFPH
ncbi:MAG: hypothetical protein WD802_07910 [Gemmatimonadaceae bacterium]